MVEDGCWNRKKRKARPKNSNFADAGNSSLSYWPTLYVCVRTTVGRTAGRTMDDGRSHLEREEEEQSADVVGHLAETRLRNWQREQSSVCFQSLAHW
jgi:hypothetical protein